MKLKRPFFLGLAGIAAVGTGCTGTVSGGGSNPPGTSSGSGGAGGGVAGTPNPPINPGSVTVPPTPFEPATALSSVRKVKNLLTGLTPTDADVATVTTMGAAGLQTLINTWMTDPEFQDKFRERMLFFFRNSFQQTGFNPAEDFKPQLLTNGGFDFANTPGDDIFPRLVQNIEDSFALTAWQLIAEGRPFSEVLTTRRFMMTTALKATYLQIEMPRDTRGTAAPTISWKVDESGVDIPIEQIVDPASPNYLTFADVAPTVAGGSHAGLPRNGRHGQSLHRFQHPVPGVAGSDSTVRHATVAGSPTPPSAIESRRNPISRCRTSATGNGSPCARSIPARRGSCRTTFRLCARPRSWGSRLPRVGFFTTPAFLALWNTNDSNQHRVTANQTLLVALGQSFTSANSIVPLSAAGLDANHAVDGTECYGCHKSLDPLRQFWGTQLDFNDRNDFIARAGNGIAANPRPATTGGGFAFGNLNTTGADIFALGPLLGQVADLTDPNQAVNRFAIAMTQKLCFFANSSPCVESDPEFRRIAHAFETNNTNFASLVKELLSSPLVTGAKPTTTSDMMGLTVSISRRDQLCMALSNRLGKPDLCGLAVPVPSTTQAATLKIATSVPADAFSRGSEFPITASTPTLFYAAAGEMLCENIATQVVDATTGSVFSSSTPPAAIADMVQRVMGYPPSDPLYAGAVKILQDNYNAHIAAKASATNALRSTFALACEAPTTLSFGL